MIESLTITRNAVEKTDGLDRGNASSVRLLSLLLFVVAGGSAQSEAADSESPWQFSSDQRERATISLRRQVTKDSGAPDRAIELSTHLFLLGRREEAIRALLAAHAVARSPEERSRLEARVRVIARSFLTVEGARNYQAGLNALISGELKLAISRFDSVLSSEQQVLDAVMRKGQAELMLERFDSAAESFRLARQIDPFEAEVRLWLGFALLERGEKDEGQQEILAAWKMADSTQRQRPHWKAWNARVQSLQSRSGAAKRSLVSEFSRACVTPNENSGWSLWILIQLDPFEQGRVRKFLNLFPNGYRRLVGKEGLDLDWWDPRLLKSEN